ncbi:hypothetical protein PCL_11389 [Purpureocillium lilacinum]|uniref:Uncharacterized protein n=1 Tax=Purpureocillium lilacinum TaxID=33203 RepID=A0A2U3E9W3_PURLI|nr:hypothetical protein PCL_11389 [Purpureocillium lilacinum]
MKTEVRDRLAALEPPAFTSKFRPSPAIAGTGPSWPGRAPPPRRHHPGPAPSCAEVQLPNDSTDGVRANHSQPTRANPPVDVAGTIPC